MKRHDILRSATLVAALILAGAGCDLSTKITLKNPFGLIRGGVDDSATATAAVRLEQGFGFSTRPSFLSVTGTISDLLGADGERKTTVESVSDDAVKISWKETKDGKERSGTVTAAGRAEADEMLLPAFWKEGDVSVSGNGIVWLSKDAFAGLKADGVTEWRLGLPGEKTVGTVDAALKAFNSISASLSGTASASATSTPFTLRKTGSSANFPLPWNGGSATFRVIFASSWFADYAILDNAENPLILRVSVHPLALTALDKLQPLGVDAKAVGYEVVSLTSPQEVSGE